jgi:UDP-glucose 4-epimerase
MNILVTGGAGFIGSHLVDTLVQSNEVTVVDNLSNGNINFVNKKAQFIKADLYNDEISALFQNIDMVFHFAANPDVRIGTTNTKVHLDQNIIVTYHVLEAMRINNIRKIVFASTSAVYGEAVTPTPENWGPLFPISLYGASKLACEGLISSYCHSFDLQAWVIRFANVIGPRSGHGVIYDFLKKLNSDPDNLEILGNGNQTKSYIHVKDCIGGILSTLQANEKVNLFNLGSDDQLKVKRIAEIIVEVLGLNTKFHFTGGDRGWAGDVPVMLLSTQKLKYLGWKAAFNSETAVRETIMGMIQAPAAL